MRRIVALLALLALPLSAHAQESLEGDWALTFMMSETNAQTLDLHAEVVDDALTLTASSAHGDRAMEEVSYSDEILKFVFPTGHGIVTCTLYKDKESDGFSGLCNGDMGDIPTTMQRSDEDEKMK